MVPKPKHVAKYWARVTKGMDFTDANLLAPVTLNRVLWKGILDNRPYPASLRQESGQKPKKDTDRAKAGCFRNHPGK
jgi:hypothetical protein